MFDARLTASVHEYFLDQGAALVGVADLTALPGVPRRELPRGIAFGMLLRPEIIAGLLHGPTPAYFAEYERLNEALNVLATRATAWLRDQGYRAEAQDSTITNLDRATLSTPLPQKTVATRAGLGWIGKCALLVTPQFGSALRFNSVLTDAPLTPDTPIEASHCPDACTACRECCPGGAPTGAQWHPDAPRESFYDAFACFRAARALSAVQEIPAVICGRCIGACPHTQRYYTEAVR